MHVILDFGEIISKQMLCGGDLKQTRRFFELILIALWGADKDCSIFQLSNLQFWQINLVQISWLAVFEGFTKSSCSDACGGPTGICVQSIFDDIWHFKMTSYAFGES